MTLTVETPPLPQWINIWIITACALTGGLLVWPRLANASLWRATMTPLASIIGSGFLVLGPILIVSYGSGAPIVMAGLCAVAALFGRAIRFNIAWLDNPQQPSPLEHRLEQLSAWALAFAYFISVAYYLNLLGAFAVSLTDIADDQHAKLVTSAVFVLILLVGWTRGFGALERMEQISVGVKLAIIAGLLVGLIWVFAARAQTGALVVSAPSLTGWPAVTMGFGLLVTVQGFETARYLGDSYNAATRIRAMKMAQWLSAAIYMVYISCLTFVFAPSALHLEETAIITLMAVVAPILPVLLVAAALSAQFSAAVADTAGSGGLINELTNHRLPVHWVYAILVGFGLVLTWQLQVFAIIGYASRAFALYYALQSLVAAARVWRSTTLRSARICGTAGYGALAGLGLVIVIFGTSIE